MADQEPTKTRSPSPSERPISTPEDPDTAAARKELDNTVISDKPDLAPMATTRAQRAREAQEKTVDRDGSSSPHEKLKEQMSSPKKKRAHDEVDQNKDSPQKPNGDVSSVVANGNGSFSRTDRSEPEKKRYRDISSEVKADAKESTPEPAESKETTANSDKTLQTKKAASLNTAKDTKTSESAFKSSGLSGFASQASPFLQSGGKPLSSFASASASPSPFGASASSKSDTPSLFGTATLSNGASPFGQFGSASKTFGGSVFGSGFGGGLGSLGSNTLTTFGKPGDSLKSSKPAKPFGAPESDADSDDGEDGDENDNDDVEEDSSEKQEKQNKEEKETEDDKKKTRLQRVTVDDGEAGEITILQVRAKIYHLDKSTKPPAWKERGAGNLKVNVPETCIELDENNQPVPGTFDGSALDKVEHGITRLIMRQDSTLRVILNTAIIPEMIFQEKPTSKAVCVLFTAIEGEGEAVNIQLKMNAANAKAFLEEVKEVQYQLQVHLQSN